MPSPLRSLILAMPFVLAATLVAAPIPTVYTLASPIALPMAFRNADYEGHFAPIAHATRHNVAARSYLHVGHSKAPDRKRNPSVPLNADPEDSKDTSQKSNNTLRAFRRNSLGFDELLAALSVRRDDALTNSAELQSMASQSASRSGDDPAFQRNAAARFSSLYSNNQEAAGILGQLSVDKGLANYDKTNTLETSLKDLVNANKDALSAVSTMIYNIPTLGPILGPTVYELKCIIDDILNAIENVTDELLNALAPSLLGLSSNANDVTCSSNVKILGLCV